MTAHECNLVDTVGKAEEEHAVLELVPEALISKERKCEDRIRGDKPAELSIAIRVKESLPLGDQLRLLLLLLLLLVERIVEGIEEVILLSRIELCTMSVSPKTPQSK